MYKKTLIEFIVGMVMGASIASTLFFILGLILI